MTWCGVPNRAPLLLAVGALTVLLSPSQGCSDSSYSATLEDSVRASSIVLEGRALNHTVLHTAGGGTVVAVEVRCILKDDGKAMPRIIDVKEVGDRKLTGFCFESELSEGEEYLLFLRPGGTFYLQQAAALLAASTHLETRCGLGGQARAHALPLGVAQGTVTCPEVTYKPCPSPTAPHSSGRRTKSHHSKRPPHTAPPRTTAPPPGGSGATTTQRHRKRPRAGNGSGRPVVMVTPLLGALLGVLLRVSLD